ncbi:hypothetical protein [Natronococcus jeotgali]|uniref:Uncharacterized protein n=1 Tax=Natronococcus jeotgali DSM 18795 TaxID=1227498 RepID=L9XX61_9EURY|nr:hypothetical protein [Natronococcus jeotgali]ELY66424.1 hypothetical protein C492_00829 [Natronococcus jeotgali DSM 18795]
MKHPDGSCLRCGGRLFGHADGGYACHNCDARHLLEPGPGPEGGGSSSRRRNPNAAEGDNPSLTR